MLSVPQANTNTNQSNNPFFQHNQPPNSEMVNQFKKQKEEFDFYSKKLKNFTFSNKENEEGFNKLKNEQLVFNKPKKDNNQLELESL